MKLKLLAIGRTRNADLASVTDEYVRRMRHYLPFEYVMLPDVRNTKAMSEARQKEAEGALILGAVGNRDMLVLLDERGREMTSRQFSDYIQKHTVSAPGDIVFAVGGPYGFSPDVYQRANAMLSLSKMTFPHEMVRLFFVEQLYRAMTIARGEPYHHD